MQQRLKVMFNFTPSQIYAHYPVRNSILSFSHKKLLIILNGVCVFGVCDLLARGDGVH